jgi:hypothetical protein
MGTGGVSQTGRLRAAQALAQFSYKHIYIHLVHNRTVGQSLAPYSHALAAWHLMLLKYLTALGISTQQVLCVALRGYVIILLTVVHLFISKCIHVHCLLFGRDYVIETFE